MKPSDLRITRPTLPPLHEVTEDLAEIWNSQVLTNCGPFHDAFEQEVAHELGVEHLSLVSNATLGLILAFAALGLRGEVITTPFSFAATSNSLRWAGLKPVFVDIDPVTLNLNPDQVANSISPSTSAILPVHLFGRVCDTEGIAMVAEQNNLKVIYDAAQAFKVRQHGHGIMSYGDMAVVSFHATKIFHSVEGGAIACRTREEKLRIDGLRSNGINDDGSIDGVGLNAKLSELHAAVGRRLLGHVDSAIAQLGEIDAVYRRELSSIAGLRMLEYPSSQTRTYGYFPIVIDAGFGATRDDLFTFLNEKGVLAKRYFWPLLSDLPSYAELPSAKCENLPVAHAVSQSILCLPQYPGLTLADIQRVVSLVKECA